MKSGIKMFLSIFISIFLIVAAMGIVTLTFFKNKIEETTINDMGIVVDMANQLVVNNINQLYFGVSTVSSMLYDNPSNEWDIKLKRLNEKMTVFTGIFLIDTQKNVVISSGKYPVINKDCIEQSVETARKNGLFISSTHTSEHDGKIVYHVVTPFVTAEKDTFFIVGTIDGMYFCNLLNKFHFWKSGHLSIYDAEGFVLANPREEWVQNRINPLKDDLNGDERFTETIKNMTFGKNGIAEYKIDGVERIVFYQPISAENLGWSISLVAPKNEGPFNNFGNALKFGGLIGILIGFFIAFVNGIFAQKTFNKMEQLEIKAVNASEEKSRFLSNMSHEMRTPLNAIIGFSELASGSEKLDEENQKYIENIHNSGIMLLELINDILDLHKIEAGKYEILPVNYYTASMINDVISTNLVKIGSKNIDFRVFCSPNLFANLNGDNLRVKQIFNNLLSNAIKYTKEGFVEWKIDVERNADGLFIVSSIEDSGIGIKDEDIKKLFGVYSQVDTKSNRKVEGTGLGLFITKRLLELMGGEVTVKSSYGKGSIFSFRFRQDFVSDEVIGEEISRKLREFKYIDFSRNKKSHIERIHIPYAKILIVDDVMSNLEVAKGLMKPYGMEVDVASSGEEAIDKICRNDKKYNAVFMDHMMPEMDGIEALKIIRELGTEYAKNLPVIALTANAMVGNDKSFLEAGFNDFLSKPIDIIRLDEIIKRWCVNKSLESAEKISKEDENNEILNNEQQKIDNLNIDGLNVRDGLSLVGFDYNIFSIAIKSFLSNYTDIRTKLENAFTEKNLQDYMINVHGFKSSLRVIGANELGKSAEDLEFKSRDGDWDFVEKNHRKFIDGTDILVAAVADKLKEC